MNSYLLNNDVPTEPTVQSNAWNTGVQETVVQEVMHSSEKVFDVLKKILTGAGSEILIATFWFTDSILFDIVLERINAGVKVDIIIVDNQDNDKLPFERITEAGGNFIKIKSDASVVLRQKLCVVDRKMTLYGAYNFSVNARNNNTVSVTYTTLPKTVQEMVAAFDRLKNQATAVNSGIPLATVTAEDYENDNTRSLNNIPVEEERKTKPDTRESSHIGDFQRELTILIETELNHFNREELHRNGYTRSSACGGDPNTLSHSLDTIYYTALNDVTVSTEKKTRLLLKINDLKAKKMQELDIESAQKQNLIKTEHATRKETCIRTVKEKKAEIEKNEKKIAHIAQIDIADRRKIIAGHDNEIITLKKEYIQPAHKLFELIPLCIINGLLLLYLILFYSSAAYIITYSKEDIQANIESPSMKEISVFEPNAIINASHHGIFGFIFVVFFFILPVGFTLSGRFIDIDKKVKRFIMENIIGLLFIDFVVALFISKSIMEVKILTNQSGEHWTLLKSFTEINFYLVFAMGSMALLIFRYAYDKMMLAFAERNPTINAQKAKMEIEYLEMGIKVVEQQIIDFEKEKARLELDNIDHARICRDNEHQLETLPASEAREIDKVQFEYTTTRQQCEHSANMYINRVENNHSKISMEALRDRINTYLEGWNEFLHNFFSYKIAIEKSAMATEIVSNWINEKLVTNPNILRLNN